MAKKHSSSLLWNVGFLLIVIVVAVLSYQYFYKKEGFTTDTSVIEKIKKGNGVIVVTMKNCPHCTKMEEDLKQLSESSEYKSSFAWVDGSSRQKENGISDLNVSSFPTILSFKNGIPNSESDKRSKEELEDLIKSTQSS
jgi:thioredoxin-like negative regulator of GroEL